MRRLILCALLVGCTADTSGLAEDITLPGRDAALTDDSSHAGDATEPLFDADESDSSAPALDAEVETSPAVDAVVVDSAADAGKPDADSGSDSGSDSGTADSGTPDSGAVDTGAAVDTGTTSPFLPAAGKVVCTDGMGGNKLCSSGQICCGTSGGYACTSSCDVWNKDYRCDERADCPSAEICCLKVGLSGGPEGSECRNPDWCIGGRLCQTNAECGSGKICQPYKPSGAPYTMGKCN